MGEGNGFLRLGERAKAIASIVVAISAGGAALFGVFAFGVSYATSDLRDRVDAHDRSIASIGGQVYNGNRMLVHLADALEEPAGSPERRAALKRMREVGVGIPYVKEVD